MRVGLAGAVGMILMMNVSAAERQITTAPHCHVLTHVNAWSPDGRWLVYDVRSGDDFNGARIERVEVVTGVMGALR